MLVAVSNDGVSLDKNNTHNLEIECSSSKVANHVRRCGLAGQLKFVGSLSSKQLGIPPLVFSYTL